MPTLKPSDPRALDSFGRVRSRCLPPSPHRPGLGRFGRIAAGVLCLSAATFGAARKASAQTPMAPTEKSLEVQLFQTAIGPRSFLTVDSATVPAHLQWGVGLMLNYQTEPFQLFTVTGMSGMQTKVSVVESQMGGELQGALGILGNLQVG